MTLHFALEHTAGPDVSRLNGDQILLGQRVMHPSKEAIGLS